MANIKITLLALTALWSGCCLFAQKETFTRQDTLRGSITVERAWWGFDLLSFGY